MPEPDRPIPDQTFNMPEPDAPTPDQTSPNMSEPTTLTPDQTTPTMSEPYPPFSNQTIHNMSTTYPPLPPLYLPPERSQQDQQQSAFAPPVSHLASDPMWQSSLMDVDDMSVPGHPASQQPEHGAAASVPLESRVLPTQRSRGINIDPVLTPSPLRSQERGIETIYQQIQRDHQEIERAQQEQLENPTRSAVIPLLNARPTELPTMGMHNMSVPAPPVSNRPELGSVPSIPLRSRAIPPHSSEQWVHNMPLVTTESLPRHHRAQRDLQYSDMAVLLRSLPTQPSPTQAHPATPSIEVWARERAERDAQQGGTAVPFTLRPRDVPLSAEQTNALQDRSLLFPEVSHWAMEMAMERAEEDAQRAAATTQRAAANAQRATVEAQLGAIATTMRAAIEAQHTAQNERQAAARREMRRIEREAAAARDQERNTFEAVRAVALADLVRQGYSLPINVSLGMQRPSVPRRARRRAEREAQRAAGAELMREGPTWARSASAERTRGELAAFQRRREERESAMREERRLASEAAAREESRQAAAELQELNDELDGLNGFECLICSTRIPLDTTSCDACLTNTEFWSPAQIIRAQIAKAKGLQWNEYPSRDGGRCVLCDSYLICKGEEKCRFCLYKTMGITAVWKFR
ncbi:uncharacterized protein H6S33_010991 [Morchella sextelata]|uniref:uncharacterized protein n=1 Tax=Morchella sextelata TaxID=1174677 RepID=UPI001D03975F|nr:uncharacterized protein H6S33_010991 [Morchella sextelata]KAH0611726.1 hypothetical protein H6S33_010991 [Morchella sextelata]